MAIGEYTQWEFRPTNGLSTNGGGFNITSSSAIIGGVDRSQQNGPFVSVGSGSITSSLTTGSGNFSYVAFTGATYSAGSADVGNMVYLDSGSASLSNIYEIVAISNTGSTSWTLDKFACVASNTITNAVMYMGGAKQLLSTGSALAAITAGHTAWIKNETWAERVVFVVGNTGNAGSVTSFIGYNTTRGDNPAMGSPNMPRNNMNGSAGIIFNATNIIGLMFKNIWLSNSGSSGAWNNTSINSSYVNCKASNNTGYGFNVCGTMINCEANNNTSVGFNPSSGVVGLQFGCYSHDNTGVGFNYVGNVTTYSLFCISESNASHGFTTGITRCVIINNTVNNNTGASTDGYNSGAMPMGTVVFNNIFTNNGRYGANAVMHRAVVQDYNNFFGNVTAARNGVFPVGSNDLLLDPGYIDAPNVNFTIGTNLKAKGWPGNFSNSTTTGYLDIGAVQRQEVTASTNATFSFTTVV